MSEHIVRIIIDDDHEEIRRLEDKVIDLTRQLQRAQANTRAAEDRLARQKPGYNHHKRLTELETELSDLKEAYTVISDVAECYKRTLDAYQGNK